MKIEITAELLEQQAIKHNIHLYDVRNCSICDLTIGYYFDNNLPENENGTIKLKVIWDGSCNCTNFSNVEIRSWQDIVDLYNLNKDNPQFVEKFHKDWYIDELQPKSQKEFISKIPDFNIDVAIEETKLNIDGMSLFMIGLAFNNLSDNDKRLINNVQNNTINYLSILEQYKKQLDNELD